MSTSNKHIEFERNYCEHYAPQPGGPSRDYCALGCGSSERMKTAMDSGAPRMSPCIGGHNAPDVLALCPKWERRSLERAENHARAVADMMERMGVVMPFVSKWRTWTRVNRVAKQEVVNCPQCGGRLHLSQSAYNGHVHGKCETEGCVAWME